MENVASRMFPEQQWGWDPWAEEQAGEAKGGGPAANAPSSLLCEEEGDLSEWEEADVLVTLVTPQGCLSKCRILLSNSPSHPS